MINPHTHRRQHLHGAKGPEALGIGKRLPVGVAQVVLQCVAWQSTTACSGTLCDAVALEAAPRNGWQRRNCACAAYAALGYSGSTQRASTHLQGQHDAAARPIRALLLDQRILHLAAAIVEACDSGRGLAVGGSGVGGSRRRRRRRDAAAGTQRARALTRRGAPPSRLRRSSASPVSSTTRGLTSWREAATASATPPSKNMGAWWMRWHAMRSDPFLQGVLCCAVSRRSCCQAANHDSRHIALC